MGFEKGKTLTNKYEWDFAVDGGATAAIAMRNLGYNDIVSGCHITKMTLVVETEVTSGGTPTIVIGNTTDADGYFADVKAMVFTGGKAALQQGEVAGALIWDDTNDHKIVYSPTAANDLDLNVTVGTAALTAGKLTLYVDFFRS